MLRGPSVCLVSEGNAGARTGSMPAGACRTFISWAAPDTAGMTTETRSARQAARRPRLARKLTIGENLLHSLNFGRDGPIEIKQPASKNPRDESNGDKEAGNAAHLFFLLRGRGRPSVSCRHNGKSLRPRLRRKWGVAGAPPCLIYCPALTGTVLTIR